MCDAESSAAEPSRPVSAAAASALDAARIRLLAAQEETLALISALSSDISELTAAREGDNSDDEHDPEGSTLAFERSQASTLVSDARQRWEEITSALGRVEAGTYGVCLRCGESIAAIRLEVRPFAALCIDCAR